MNLSFFPSTDSSPPRRIKLCSSMKWETSCTSKLLHHIMKTMRTSMSSMHLFNLPLSNHQRKRQAKKPSCLKIMPCKLKYSTHPRLLYESTAASWSYFTLTLFPSSKTHFILFNISLMTRMMEWTLFWIWTASKLSLYAWPLKILSWAQQLVYFISSARMKLKSAHELVSNYSSQRTSS